ncbi:MAG: lysine--tRNA ligase [Clostridia bacterium]|jgi:lysyl-tRNA synthetase class 2|nr:lysine--tRNA ligase [Clostridia bacterium]
MDKIIENTEMDLNEILRVRREKLDTLKKEGRNPFDMTRFDREYTAKELLDNFDKFQDKEVSLAGRIMAKRIMGKASFCHIQDGLERIQLYVRVDELGEDSYSEFKKYDIGDIVGITGLTFVTHMGEKSIRVKSMVLLTKSLQPLPEKFHGLKDMDLRYRQRYVDLIVNPEVKSVFITRAKIIKAIREYMSNLGYLEVETPVLHNQATNANARPFCTHQNTLDIDMYLRIELELNLKKLIVGGLDKIFEIGKVFRNEGMDTRHNPEFTLMEFYEAYGDLYTMMDRAEQIYCYVADNVLGTRQIDFQGQIINLESPWRRLTMIEAVKEYSGVDFDSFTLDDEAAKKAAKEKNVHVESHWNWGMILNAFFEEYVEKNLIQPTFIYQYPIEISPLAKRNKDKPHLTERFEFFILASEMGNAFSELNDPVDQKERLIAQAKSKFGEYEFTIDEDFINALEIGMPPTGGMGLGVERMIMLFTNSVSIRDVMFFPTMKPESNG